MTTTGSFVCIGVAIKIPDAPKSILVKQGSLIRNGWVAAGVLSLCAPVKAQDLESYHEGGVFAGRSFHVFGSHEIRDSLGFFFGTAKPDPKITHGDWKGHLVYEGYLEFNTNTGDLEVLNPYQTGALGGLAICRWTHRGMFCDLGIGLQLQNHVGFDLPSYINSTPVAGVGWVAHTRGREMLIGLRFLHISNADTHRENAGQNQLLAYISVLKI